MTAHRAVNIALAIAILYLMFGPLPNGGVL
jgi:hypothetical protein